MALPATLTPERDALTTLGDDLLEAQQAALLFAYAVAYGHAPDDLTAFQVGELAERFVASAGKHMPYRYWGGKRISGPAEALEEAP